MSDPSLLEVSRYRTMSVLSVTGSISVGKALVELQLSDIPDYVEKGLTKLSTVVYEAEDALAERLDRKADLGLERSFDLLVDRIWVSLRARLEFWHCYLHQGITLLTPEQAAGAEVEQGRKHAAVAEELLARLFGDGVDFLRMPYPQQASHMAARLRYIESRGLQAEFVELVGVQPAALARVCQKRYEAMVAERSSRDNAVIVDLRPLRAKIKLAAENYAGLLLATLDEGDEQWAKSVLSALRPMLITERMRTTSGGEELVDELELIDPEQPELLDVPSETDPE